MLSARARFSFGARSEISEWAAGEQPASPMPTPIRNNSICRKLVAMPHSAVMPLHAMTLTAIRRGRSVVALSA